ncbi:S-layer homology domain-containing protein [Solibacillus silvestris]|uniref:S-layer homology domain-containing protein n=1 Tax=Solibacillus silvestris TaxID=76853 RepID=UPI003F7DA1BE
MANQPKKYKKFVATAATATLVASAIVPVASAASLSDISGNTHEGAINALVDAKVISGYPDGTFKPNKELTRSDVVKLLGKYLVSQGHSVPADATSNPRFSDLSSKSNKELLEYAAVVADAGVFAGSNGKLLAGDAITRENMAIVLVRMVNTLKDVSLEEYIASQDFTREVKDINAAKAEARTAIDVLDFYDITTVTNFLPKNTVTRGQFATFLNNVINADFTGASASSGAVKAINNTTVEVAFASDIEDIKDLTFTIDGLKVTNAIVKQTAKNVAVLTTEAQEGGKEYTVSVDGTEIGKFTGIAAVIPTEIKVETTSIQSKVGQQVTLKATTTPGAAVTFNVQATGNSLNENKKYEVTAGTDGVATYTYTQYGVAGVDNVTVYPTGAPSLLGYAKVYWGQDTILTVDTDEKTIDNGANRTYTVTYKDPTSGQPLSGKTLNVTFKENLNDIDGSKTNDTTASIRKIDGLYVTPYQDSAATAGSHREETFTVVTNSVGQATFVVTGKNTTATPIVFADADANNRYGATELQAVAGAAKFQGVQSPYTITFDRTADFVAAMSEEYGQQNPIAYKVKVVTDKKNDKGEPIPYAGATIKVAIQQNQDASLSNNTPAQIATSSDGSYTTNGVVSLVTNANGEATVYLKSAVDNTKATPVAWIDLNTAGNNAAVGNDKLEDGEPNAVAPTVTFLKSVVVGPNYKLNTPTAGSFIQGDTMVWNATLTNQSGNASETAGIKNATYTITNTSNSIQTINPRLVDAAGTNYTGLTITYAGQTQTQGFVNGSSVRLEPGTTVTIHGNAPGLVAATSTVAEYSNTNDALLEVVAPNQAGKISVSSYTTTVRKTVTQDTRNNNNTYTNDAKEAQYIASTLATGTVTGEVIGYEVVDKTATANKFKLSSPATYYGRVVVQERFTNVVNPLC